MGISQDAAAPRELERDPPPQRADIGKLRMKSLPECCIHVLDYGCRSA
jgi:hypothetical protein